MILEAPYSVHTVIQRGDTLLDKYSVEHVLGQGGMGTVLAARHIELDELFAIKLMRAGIAQAETMISRFVREARAAAHLNSPHIARVHDVGRLSTGEPYMVMEYLRGCNLRELITHHGPLPYAHACLLMRQACEGIAEAHAHGIIHRDLKLENMFITHLRDGRPCLKILDFGISKFANESKELTHSGILLGSLRYMSPEQMRNAKSVDARADVWAIGAIFYEILTGHPAFPGENLPTIIDNVLESDPLPLSQVCPDVPPAVEEAIRRCLSKQPEGRYPTIDDLADVVTKALPVDTVWPRVYFEWANTFASKLTAPNKQDQDASSVRKVAEANDQSGVRSAVKQIDVPRDPTHLSRGASATLHERRLICISCRSDARTDVEIARGFATALATFGLRVFVPTNHGENSAQNWIDEVDQAIHRCTVFVILLSEQAAASELVASQLALAQELNAKTPGRPQILSVRLPHAASASGATPVPTVLGDLHHVEWAGPQDTKTVVAAILERVGLELPKDARLPAWPGAQAPTPPPVRVAQLPLEQPGGIVQASSPFYVANPTIERRCREELRKPGALVRVKSPRRMGKTSLIMGLLDDANKAGMRVAHIDLNLADSNILCDLDRFLRWICAVLSRRLALPRATIEWDDVFGPKDNCTAYFEDHFFGSGKPLVLALKNIDRLFGAHEVAEEFMILLRAWHEMTKSSSQWQELRMILSYSTEMYMPLDINHSPFNVGLAVNLTDWESHTVLELAHRHGLNWRPDEVEKLMRMIGGHPHLVRIALHHLAETGANLDEVLATAANDEGLFADHVRHLLWHLKRQPTLASAAAQVMQARGPLRLPTEFAFKLVSLGVVQMRGDLVSPGRELYRRYLGPRLNVEPSSATGTTS